MAAEPGLYLHKFYASLTAAQADTTLQNRMLCFVDGQLYRKYDGSIFPVGTFLTSSSSSFPAAGDSKTLYIDTTSLKFYFWNGSSYRELKFDYAQYNDTDGLSLGGRVFYDGETFYITNNCYLDRTDSKWKILSGLGNGASRFGIKINGSEIKFESAPAGALDSEITTWTQVYKLNSTGIIEPLSSKSPSDFTDGPNTTTSLTIKKTPDNLLTVKGTVETDSGFGTLDILTELSGNPFGLTDGEYYPIKSFTLADFGSLESFLIIYSSTVIGTFGNTADTTFIVPYNGGLSGANNWPSVNDCVVL